MPRLRSTSKMSKEKILHGESGPSYLRKFYELQVEPAGTEQAYTGAQRKRVEICLEEGGVELKGTFFLSDILDRLKDVLEDPSYPEHSCPRQT